MSQPVQVHASPIAQALLKAIVGGLNPGPEPGKHWNDVIVDQDRAVREAARNLRDVSHWLRAPRPRHATARSHFGFLPGSKTPIPDHFKNPFAFSHSSMTF
jgi:hypothetical protein